MERFLSSLGAAPARWLRPRDSRPRKATVGAERSRELGLRCSAGPGRDPTHWRCSPTSAIRSLRLAMCHPLLAAARLSMPAIGTYAFERIVASARNRPQEHPRLVVPTAGWRASRDRGRRVLARDLIITPATIWPSGLEQAARRLPSGSRPHHGDCGDALLQANYPMIHGGPRHTRRLAYRYRLGQDEHPKVTLVQGRVFDTVTRSEELSGMATHEKGHGGALRAGLAR